MNEISRSIYPEFDQVFREFAVVSLAAKKALYLISKHAELNLTKEEDALFHEHSKATLQAESCFRRLMQAGIPPHMLPSQLLIDSD